MNWLWMFARVTHDDGMHTAEARQPRIAIWGALAVLLAFFGWASVAELDEVTRAQGNVIPSSRTQLIQSQDGGVLEALLVQEGQWVSQGEVIARIDRTRALASYLETRATVAALTARKERLEAELLGREPVFSALVDLYPMHGSLQLELMQQRQSALGEELQALEVVRQLLQEELTLNLPLLESGDVSKTELLRLERQVAETFAQITNKRNAWFQDAQAELSEVHAQLSSLEQQLVQRRNFLDQTELVAPVNGIVKNINITTVGGVVRAGDDVMQIVPIEDDLLVEGKLNPRDIAHVHEGMRARVKIDAYDFTIYGDLPAELIFISADTMREDERQGEQPYYRVRVRTDGRRFSATPDRDLNIQPGMTATIELKTGRRTVLRYLTKPVVKTLAESMMER